MPGPASACLPQVVPAVAGHAPGQVQACILHALAPAATPPGLLPGGFRAMPGGPVAWGAPHALQVLCRDGCHQLPGTQWLAPPILHVLDWKTRQ